MNIYFAGVLKVSILAGRDKSTVSTLTTHQHTFSFYNQGQHNGSTIQDNIIMQSPLHLLKILHGKCVSDTASEDKLLFYCNSSILRVN